MHNNNNHPKIKTGYSNPIAVNTRKPHYNYSPSPVPLPSPSLPYANTSTTYRSLRESQYQQQHQKPSKNSKKAHKPRSLLKLAGAMVPFNSPRASVSSHNKHGSINWVNSRNANNRMSVSSIVNHGNNINNNQNINNGHHSGYNTPSVASVTGDGYGYGTGISDTEDSSVLGDSSEFISLSNVNSMNLHYQTSQSSNGIEYDKDGSSGLIEMLKTKTEQNKVLNEKIRHLENEKDEKDISYFQVTTENEMLNARNRKYSKELDENKQVITDLLNNQQITEKNENLLKEQIKDLQKQLTEMTKKYSLLQEKFKENKEQSQAVATKTTKTTKTTTTATQTQIQKSNEKIENPKNAKIDKNDKNDKNVKNKHTSKDDKCEKNDKKRLSSSSNFSGISKVSSLDEPIVSSNPLIVTLGIGKYDSGLPNLAGVLKDYQNINNVFTNNWKYSVLYKMSDNNTIYTNDVNTVKNNSKFKIHWSLDEIDDFVAQARKYIIENKHDGLIFSISCHGDTNKIIYDSFLDSYELENIFQMFQPQCSELIEDCQETENESSRLFKIPKIFLLGCCRGQFKSQISKINNNENENDSKEKENNESNNDNKDMKTQTKKDNSNKTVSDKKSKNSAKNGPNNNNNNNNKDNDSENLVCKGLTKLEANNYSSEMANFCKVYANTEGCAVFDGKDNGDYLLRNLVKVFEDPKFIRENTWNDIVVKITNYVKRDTSHAGDKELGINFTQMVEKESTLEKNVFFAANNENSNCLSPKYTYKKHSHQCRNRAFSDDLKQDVIASPIEEIDETQPQLTITNSATNNEKLAVLVESEDDGKDRNEFLGKMELASIEELKQNKFVIINPSETYTTEKNSFTVISAFIVGGNNGSNNEEMWDRKKCDDNHDSYIYFEDSNTLKCMNEIRLQCTCTPKDKNNNKIHYLKEKKTRWVNENGETNDNRKCDECNNMLVCGACCDVYYFCRKCDYSLCQQCCHKRIMNDRTNNNNSNNSNDYSNSDSDNTSNTSNNNNTCNNSSNNNDSSNISNNNNNNSNSSKLGIDVNSINNLVTAAIATTMESMNLNIKTPKDKMGNALVERELARIRSHSQAQCVVTAFKAKSKWIRNKLPISSKISDTFVDMLETQVKSAITKINNL